MTTANKITLCRILMIPVFICFLIYYVEGYKEGRKVEWLRWAACAVFLLAAVSDGIDGYIARKYNQISRLGTLLDPLADKLLLLSAIIVLLWDHGQAFERVPNWFAILVLSKDVLSLIAFFLIHSVVGKTRVKPRLVGKISTFLLMITIAWILVKFPAPYVFVHLTAFFIFISGMWYLFDGAKQLAASPASVPEPVAGDENV